MMQIPPLMINGSPHYVMHLTPRQYALIVASKAVDDAQDEKPSTDRRRLKRIYRIAFDRQLAASR